MATEIQFGSNLMMFAWLELPIPPSTWRLRLAFSNQDQECLRCDGVLDRCGDHALVCCGGDHRVRRHNLLRNLVYHAASATNLNHELEKPGLLVRSARSDTRSHSSSRSLIVIEAATCVLCTFRVAKGAPASRQACRELHSFKRLVTVACN